MAARANIDIDQGADFSTSIDVTDDDDAVIDLTGYTGESKFRKHFSSTNSHSFTVTVTANTGQVTLSMNAATSANITPGRYLYDVELTDGDGTKSRLIEGIVTIHPNMTR